MLMMEKPKRPRHWQAWAICEPDGSLYRIELGDPAKSPAIRGLVKMGWFAVLVDVTETLTREQHGR